MHRVIPIAFVVLLLATNPARAQVGSLWDACNGQDIEQVIEACTRVIEANKEPGDRLAVAYNNRGYAYTLSLIHI